MKAWTEECSNKKGDTIKCFFVAALSPEGRISSDKFKELVEIIQPNMANIECLSIEADNFQPSSNTSRMIRTIKNSEDIRLIVDYNVPMLCLNKVVWELLQHVPPTAQEDDLVNYWIVQSKRYRKYGMIVVKKERSGKNRQTQETAVTAALQNTIDESSDSGTFSAKKYAPILSPTEIVSFLIGPVRETKLMEMEDMSFEEQGNVFVSEGMKYVERGTIGDTSTTPQRVQAMIDVAVHYIQSNQNHAALKLINHILQQRNDITELYYAKAIAEFRNGSKEEAKTSLQVLLDRVPGHLGGQQLTQLLTA